MPEYSNKMSKELFRLWAHDSITNAEYNDVTPWQIQHDVLTVK